jgi:hypothetical protein
VLVRESLATPSEGNQISDYANRGRYKYGYDKILYTHWLASCVDERDRRLNVASFLHLRFGQRLGFSLDAASQVQEHSRHCQHIAFTAFIMRELYHPKLFTVAQCAITR